ncbi:MAG: SGNH/GDSL hydrolase family protein [Clostridiaceae bacterium]|nr:SGNH/GDSL hydrolase family protein [Clostridiaceae bacterium]
MKRKRVLNILIAVLILVLTLAFLEKLLMPKYMTEILEGALISEYYKEEYKEHDVIFIGDCEVYENFSPVKLWEEYGIRSFIRGSAQQLIWQSYYLLEETLKYEKPGVVVFNVLSMKYGKPQKEAYNRMALDGMPLSLSKLKSIKASMLPDEEFITYIFPILRYHSRWDELSREDIEYVFRKRKITHNGYLMRVDVKPLDTVPRAKILPNYRFDDICYEYLDKMVNLCKKNNIELVLIKAPTLYPHWYDEWDEKIKEYARENNLLYYNFLDYIDEIGIDFSTDTYDAGLHLNLSGAEKLSVYFGKILKENFNLTDYRNDDEVRKIWERKKVFYYSMKEDQYKELETYGYLKSYNIRREESEMN